MSPEFETAKAAADTRSWFVEARRHGAHGHANGGLRRRRGAAAAAAADGAADGNPHDPLADPALHPEEFENPVEHPPDEPLLEDPPMPVAGDQPDTNPLGPGHLEPQHNPVAGSHDGSPHHPEDPKPDENPTDEPAHEPNDAHDHAERPDGDHVPPHLADVHKGGDSTGPTSLVARLLNPLEPNNVFMCCCPQPYAPCTTKEADADCLAHLGAHLGPMRDMFTDGRERTADEAQTDREMVANSLQMARQSMWILDAECSSVFSVPEPPTTCNYIHPGNFHGDPDMYRVITRQDLYCESVSKFPAHALKYLANGGGGVCSWVGNQ